LIRKRCIPCGSSYRGFSTILRNVFRAGQCPGNQAKQRHEHDGDNPHAFIAAFACALAHPVDRPQFNDHKNDGEYDPDGSIAWATS
jgi:hypothetical protein